MNEPSRQIVARNDARQLTTLERSVDNWDSDIERLKHRLSETSAEVRQKYQTTLEELRERWTGVKGRLEELRGSSEQNISQAEQWARGAYRDLMTKGQRLADQVDALHGSSDERARYFLGPDAEGGWALKRGGANNPVERYATKREAVSGASRYVRVREPSELVIRRADGTFQETRTYGSRKAAA